jgi:hypothetical protein
MTIRAITLRTQKIRRSAYGGNRAVDEMAHLWLQVLPFGLTQRFARSPNDAASAVASSHRK